MIDGQFKGALVQSVPPKDQSRGFLQPTLNSKRVDILCPTRSCNPQYSSHDSALIVVGDLPVAAFLPFDASDSEILGALMMDAQLSLQSRVAFAEQIVNSSIVEDDPEAINVFSLIGKSTDASTISALETKAATWPLSLRKLISFDDEPTLFFLPLHYPPFGVESHERDQPLPPQQQLFHWSPSKGREIESSSSSSQDDHLPSFGPFFVSLDRPIVEKSVITDVLEKDLSVISSIENHSPRPSPSPFYLYLIGGLSFVGFAMIVMFIVPFL